MNRSRRKELNRILDNLEKLSDLTDRDEALEIIRNAKDDIEVCMDDEQEALDNRPESMMFSSGNEDMEENISNLSDAIDCLEEAEETCEEKDDYSYESIRGELNEAVNLVSEAIDR